MKLITMLLFILTLSGCYQTINQFDIRRAAQLCNGVDNVVEISAYMLSMEEAVCFNGQSMMLHLVQSEAENGNS